MSENEQAVADTEAEATPEAEESGEQDISELLNEFEEGESPPPEETKTEEPKEDPAVKKVEQFLFEQKMNKATDFAKEASGLDLPKDFFEDRIEGEARRNPKFLNAFLNADKNPDAFKKLMAQIGKDISRQFESFVESRKGDNDAIASAVRSAKPASEPSEDVDVRKLSAAEFATQKEGILRKHMKG